MSFTEFRKSDAERSFSFLDRIRNPALFELGAIPGEIQIRSRFHDERIPVEERVAAESVRRRRSDVAPFNRLPQRLHFALEGGAFDDVGDVLTGSAEDKLAGYRRRVRIRTRVKTGATRALREETRVHWLLRPQE